VLDHLSLNRFGTGCATFFPPNVTHKFRGRAFYFDEWA
jgi:hypothetical protein